MYIDARGLPLTTRSAGAAERFNTAVEDVLEFRPALPETLRDALAMDSRFVMANVLFGVALRMGSDDALLPRARKHLASAESAATTASPREQAHVAALRAWLDGDLHGANRIYEALLADTPQDLLALKFLTYNYFWLGDRANLRDAPGRVLERVDPDLPGYGYLLGMRAFGLEECGEYQEAEKAGRAAVEYHAGDLWAVHAVAHVFEMQCRLKEGLDWLERLAPLWKGRNNFVYHLWWHRALYLFELEQWEAVLTLYDNEIRREKTDFAPDIQNAASLLWRLELRGVEVGGRWQELAEVAGRRLADMAHPFNSLHFVMSMLRGGRSQAAQQHIEAMRRHAEARRPAAQAAGDIRPVAVAGPAHSAGDRPDAAGPTASRKAARANDPHPYAGDTLAPVFEEVAIPLCEGLAAYHDAVYTRATERLMKGFGKLQSIGASHAQRDVIVLTLIQASRDGGYLALARDFLAARTHAKQDSADAWHAYARVLELSRDIAGAAVAGARGDAIVNRSKGIA